MFHLGIQGKILTIIRDMYKKVKSCVRNHNEYSDFFEYAVGLRQGEIMSPMLFSLSIEYLELSLQENTSSGIEVDDAIIILLLFADDMVILAKSPEELQSHLNLLYEYCQSWGLKVNTEKTKIMVFRKGGNLKSTENWEHNGTPIEVVNDFNYLGTVFHFNGSFNANEQYIAGKGLKAMKYIDKLL